MKFLRTYGFSFILLASIIAGVGIGKLSPDGARSIRPLGDFFINLIFMIIVPLVFFTISSTIANGDNEISGRRRLSRLFRTMLVVFVFTSVVAAVGSMLFMLIVQPQTGADVMLSAAKVEAGPSMLKQFVSTLTAPDFPELISRKSMLPPILFSVAVGFATRQCKQAGLPFAGMLASGAQVFMRLIDYVMYSAPIGLAAFFAATVVDTGERLATTYLKVFGAYYIFGIIYFVFGFSMYAFFAGRSPGVRRFWQHMLKPSLTALGTCSSMATLPINMEAAAKMGIPSEVCNVVIPIGTAIHKDGSVIGGVAKILFAMSLFHHSLGFEQIMISIGVAMLVGVVMGAIPGGGLMGEMLIISVFGFPAETLPLLAIISVIIDPMATLLNATGHNVAAMIVTRISKGDLWSNTNNQHINVTLSD